MSYTGDLASRQQSFGPRATLSAMGTLDGAKEAMEAIEQEADYQLSDSGITNDLFGAALYVQTNLEADFYGALPKMDVSGANATAEQHLPLTFRAAHGPPALQTHSPGGSIPSGRTFSIDEVSADIKRSIAVVEQEDVQQLRADLLDGVPLDELTRVDELYQDLAIDRDAVAAGVPASGGQGNSGYSSRDEITELDRIIASGDEETNADSVNGTNFSDGDLDIYDIDRSSDSWADAYVDHNSGTNRQLTESLMDGFLSSLFDFGSISRENAAILTGRDTADVLSDLSSDKRVPFDPSDGGRDTINDAETAHGIPGTTRVRDYDGVPIVTNQNAPAHGTLSSIYVIPTDTMTINGQEVPRICVEEYATPYVETAGRGESQGFLSQGEFKNKVLFKMDHEIVCRDFSSTGKLRDLKE